jgi:hypothetical protein
MVDASGLETFSSYMASDSQRILMALAAHNDYKVGVGDINNAYLLATSKENINSFFNEAFFRAGYTVFAIFVTMSILQSSSTTKLPWPSTRPGKRKGLRPPIAPSSNFHVWYV